MLRLCEFCNKNPLLRNSVRFCSERCAVDARTAPFDVRFWAKVDKRGPYECWPWIGARLPKGYGKLWILQTRSTEYTHRLAWILANGPIPEGKLVCHRCDNPPCCNPGHLFLGTVDDNIADKVAKRRHQFGSKHVGAKLTEADVVAILESTETHEVTATKFHIARQTVTKIRRRLSWKHVQGATA